MKKLHMFTPNFVQVMSKDIKCGKYPLSKRNPMYWNSHAEHLNVSFAFVVIISTEINLIQHKFWKQRYTIQ